MFFFTLSPFVFSTTTTTTTTMPCTNSLDFDDLIYGETDSDEDDDGFGGLVGGGGGVIGVDDDDGFGDSVWGEDEDNFEEEARERELSAVEARFHNMGLFFFFYFIFFFFLFCFLLTLLKLIGVKEGMETEQQEENEKGFTASFPVCYQIGFSHGFLLGVLK